MKRNPPTQVLNTGIKTRPISDREFEGLHETMQDVVHYRKSGLSLNHVVGCPLECSYCIRHSVGAFGMKQPTTLMSDAEAVDLLLENHYFQPDKTPIQIFNKATDPFLPGVKPHTFEVLRLLDKKGLTNHVLVITRYKVLEQDCDILNSFSNIKLTILVTYSGLDDKRLEPISNRIPQESLKILYNNARNYRAILYWRPLVPTFNDSDKHIEAAVELARFSHAVAFTGLFYRKEMKQYFEDVGMSHLSDEIARRKIMPRDLEESVLKRWAKFGGEDKLFRKTSCAVSFAHGLSDYNGHYGIREICDICPKKQIGLCQDSHTTPTEEVVNKLLMCIDDQPTSVKYGENALETVGLNEPPRYYLQHSLNFQVHDKRYPHKYRQHGRADIGW